MKCEPYPEICNGFDDDCDGKIDNINPQACSSVCGPGLSYCVNGSWAVCDSPLPKEETCNGKDDDCDGIVDNEETLGIAPCYTGDQSELLHGECRFGVKRCLVGGWVCYGAVTPQAEMCDGKDNNCNGQVDEGVSGGLDIVFLVDYSCSMTDKIEDLANVTATWANKYSSRADLKMALVGVPDDNYINDEKVTMISNLGTPRDFATSIGRHTYAGGGGQEPTLDGIWMVSQPANALHINWTLGSRKAVVVYSDEEPQSYMNPRVTETMVRNSIAMNNVQLFVFSTDSGWYSFNPRPFPLTTQLESELDQIIAKGSCQ